MALRLTTILNRREFSRLCAAAGASVMASKASALDPAPGGAPGDAKRTVKLRDGRLAPATRRWGALPARMVARRPRWRWRGQCEAAAPFRFPNPAHWPTSRRMRQHCRSPSPRRTSKRSTLRFHRLAAERSHTIQFRITPLIRVGFADKNDDNRRIDRDWYSVVRPSKTMLPIQEN